MADVTHFGKEDIGGEILPILTTGLYRDTLDALREYVQNAIDADAKSLSVSIDPSTVVVNDDGLGMTPAEARRAMRLGISDKNPTRNVGFRGIGIYSAFNLCDRLEIYTKKKGSRQGSHIVFQFGEIRKQLLTEQERRKQGLGPKLFLERLLEANVFVEDDNENIVQNHGTRVVLSDVLSDSFRPLQDWDTVANYLQDTVPLPFSPEFRYGRAITKKFEEQDYRVVPLELSIGDREAPLYRPYLDEHFAEDVKYPPKYFALRSGKVHFGFAWVCINGRRVFKEQKIRGLIIKKFDFSIGTRAYLEPYFKRTVFNRRITGEIIIQNDELLPNAARTDFENSTIRQSFLALLPLFIDHVSKWANRIQEEDKARQVLSDVQEELTDLAEKLPALRRDKDMVLRINVDLANCSHRLDIHRKTLQVLTDIQEDWAITKSLLKSCKTLVKDALTTSADASRKIERDVARVVQSEVHSKEKGRKSRSEDRPRDLCAALEAAGVSVSDDTRAAIRQFESEFLSEHIDRATYREILSRFAESLEQGL